MEKIKTVFRMPCGIVILVAMFVLLIKYMYKMGILEAIQYWESEEFKEKIVNMEEKCLPYEMAFNTIIWLLIIKYVVLLCI